MRRIMKSEGMDLLEALDTSFAQLPSREADHFTLLHQNVIPFCCLGTCKSFWSPHIPGVPAKSLPLTCGAEPTGHIRTAPEMCWAASYVPTPLYPADRPLLTCTSSLRPASSSLCVNSWMVMPLFSMWACWLEASSPSWRTLWFSWSNSSLHFWL